MRENSNNLKKIRRSVNNFLLKFGKKKDVSFLENEIESIVDLGKKEGFLDRQSADMIQNILEFREKIAREVMVPRTEIIAVISDSSIEEIINMILEHGHTRMPVYEGNIDNIIGILNVKDILKLWVKERTEISVVPVLRETYFIPETKNIHLLLHELKEKKSHMAIVIDEYGGTSGLVTLEDLIEEIVGEIHDEHDAEEIAFTELSNGEVLVDSRVEIEEFEKYFNIEVPEEKFETLGGFIFYLIEKIPVAGEVVNYENVEMIIEAADDRSIKKVRVKIKEGTKVSGKIKEGTSKKNKDSSL